MAFVAAPRKRQTRRKAGTQRPRVSQAWEAAGLPKGGSTGLVRAFLVTQTTYEPARGRREKREHLC